MVEFEIFGLPPEALDCIKALNGVNMVSVENREQKQALRVHTVNGASMVAPIVNTLNGLGLRVDNVVVREPTLEDAYVRLVGGKT